MVTNNGRPVIGDGGPITVPEDSEITIAKDGTVSMVTNNQVQNAVAIGRLKLVNPADADVVRGDDGLFRLKNGQNPEADAGVNLVSGALEASNVNPVNALLDMINASRMFDMQVKMMQKSDENTSRATQIMSLT
jgi:flagellar basal-body rod protein FlgF